MEFLQTKELYYSFICILAGLVIYYIYRDSTDKKRHLLNLFKANKKLYNYIVGALKEYMAEFNTYEAIAIPSEDITYSTWLEVMTSESKRSLLDKLYNNLKDNNQDKHTMQSMRKKLTKQQYELILIKEAIELICSNAREKRMES